MADADLKLISWEELSKHNKYNDSWIAIHGLVYDVTKWAKTHPGGDIILLGGGRDSTILYESYHASPIDARVLRKYCIGRVEKKPTYYTFESEFYPTLKARVDEYFKKSGLSHRDAPAMYIKTLLIMMGWIVTYYFGVIQGWYSAAMALGFFSAEIGVSIMHDGNHGAYSSSHLVNKVTGWGLDFIGASGFAWEFQHVVGHHPFTNLGDGESGGEEMDPDVFSSYPMMRMHPSSEPPQAFHRFQHLYGPVLFAVFTIVKVLHQDFLTLMQGHVFSISTQSRFSDPRNVARFIAMKAVSMLYMVAVPMWLHGPCKGALLFVAAHLVAGEFLALMFIVTHITEGCNFLTAGTSTTRSSAQTTNIAAAVKRLGVAPRAKPAPDTDWAALQCRTSVNWATDSWMWTHLSGGLNHQIEHHLFPGISHVHYPALRPIVQRTCAEFGVPYLSHPSLSSAIGAMLRHLKALGAAQ